MKAFIYITILLFTIGSSGQNMTMTLAENADSPAATLDQVSWIQGHYIGQAFGGKTEEIWSPPSGDSMMFVFKLTVDNKTVFYEVGGIRQIDDTLLMQLKHFGNDFKGWEEKDDTVDFKLVKIEKNIVYFDGMTFEKVSDSEINVYVVLSENGKEEEVKFNYKRL
jgi:hypothetical protein